MAKRKEYSEILENLAQVLAAKGMERELSDEEDTLFQIFNFVKDNNEYWIRDEKSNPIRRATTFSRAPPTQRDEDFDPFSRFERENLAFQAEQERKSQLKKDQLASQARKAEFERKRAHRGSTRIPKPVHTTRPTVFEGPREEWRGAPLPSFFDQKSAPESSFRSEREAEKERILRDFRDQWRRQHQRPPTSEDEFGGFRHQKPTPTGGFSQRPASPPPRRARIPSRDEAPPPRPRFEKKTLKGQAKAIDLSKLTDPKDQEKVAEFIVQLGEIDQMEKKQAINAMKKMLLRWHPDRLDHTKQNPVLRDLGTEFTKFLTEHFNQLRQP